MEKLFEVIVNNGLGVASFAALVYFYFNYMTKMEKTLVDMSKTLITMSTTQEKIQGALMTLQNQVNELKTKKESK